MPLDPYIGEIFMGGMNFTPQGYVPCQGQLLPVAQNSALYSLLGATFGGNGMTTFAVPDLRGRVPMGWGQGPGLSFRTLGQMGGQESVTLTTSEMPAHSHTLRAVSEPGDASAPAGAFLADSGPLDREYKSSGTQVSMNAGAVSANGGSQPHNNLPPYLVLNFYIATEGAYPPRP